MIKNTGIISLAAIAIILALAAIIASKPGNNNESMENNLQTFYEEIPLSTPQKSGGMPLNDTLSNRRSRRDYEDKHLTESSISMLSWSAAGITDIQRGFRTVPSAGALYPLELYIAIANVEGIEAGLYKYSAQNHSLLLIKPGDLRQDIYEVALKQQCIRDSAAVFIYTAVFERTKRVYGDRADQYVYIEAGHSAQNLYLQCEALGLGTVAIGAFDDNGLRKVLALPSEEDPVYIMPVGKQLDDQR